MVNLNEMSGFMTQVNTKMTLWLYRNNSIIFDNVPAFNRIEDLTNLNKKWEQSKFTNKSYSFLTSPVCTNTTFVPRVFA